MTPSADIVTRLMGRFIAKPATVSTAVDLLHAEELQSYRAS